MSRRDRDSRDGHVRPVRVLWLIKGLGPGGAERLLASAARSLDHAAFSVTCAYVLREKDHLTRELNAAGIETLCLSEGRAGWPWPARLASLLRNESYDVVHGHSPVPMSVCRVLTRFFPRSRRPRLIYTEHNTWDSHHRATRLLNQLTGGMDDRIFAVTHESLASMSGASRRTASVLTHGIDGNRARQALPQRAAVRQELGLRPDELVIVTVANFRAQKDYPNLLEAARILKGRSVDVRIVAVGQGPLEGEIRALAERMGLDDRVVFTGFRSDALNVLAAGDVFTMASRWEGLPVALMEATALGLPVVATAVGGIAQTLEHEADALLVPPGDAKGLADALERVAGDAALRRRLSIAARQVGDRFDVAATQRVLSEEYDRARRPRPAVLHVLPSNSFRGAQSYAMALCSELRNDDRFDHHIYSVFGGGDGHLAMHREGPPRTGGGANLLRSVVALRREVRSPDVALVVSHGSQPLRHLRIAGNKAPTVLVRIGTNAASLSRRRRRMLYRWLHKGLAAIVGVSNDALSAALEIGVDSTTQVTVIPNGRDANRFAPGSTAPGRRLVLFAGHLFEGKRPDRFLDVIEELRRREVAFDAAIAGHGPMLEQVAGRAEALGVEMLGNQPDMPSVFRNASVFVFTSEPENEGMPGVLIEAALSSIPSVAMRAPGVTDVIEHGVSGFVVEQGEVHAMANHVEQCLSSEELRTRMGAVARRTAKERFTLDATVATWRELFAEHALEAVSDAE